MSSSTAKSPNRCASSPATSFGEAVWGNGMSSCNGTSAKSRSIKSCLIFILLHKGQRACNRFQRPALGRDGVAPRDASRRDHQPRSEQVARENAVARAGVDQRAKQSRTDDAANSRSHGIEQRNRQRPDLERKGFADGEIRRTGG